ncbi:helix-turn-helix domain-containing protein [Sphingopyxis granuli]
MHREDIKAALRKKYGTIRQFEIDHNLSRGAVHEVLRNRRWAKVERAIAEALGVPESQSEKTDSKRNAGAHRLSAEVK